MTMLTTDQLAIWRRIPPARRQAVIDARWEQTGTLSPTYGCYRGGACYCPLGLALAGMVQANPTGYGVARWLTDTPWGEATDEQGLARRETIAREAWAFINAWDEGEITPDALIAALTGMQGE